MCVYVYCRFLALLLSFLYQILLLFRLFTFLVPSSPFFPSQIFVSLQFDRTDQKVIKKIGRLGRVYAKKEIASSWRCGRNSNSYVDDCCLINFCAALFHLMRVTLTDLINAIDCSRPLTKRCVNAQSVLSSNAMRSCRPPVELVLCFFLAFTWSGIVHRIDPFSLELPDSHAQSFLVETIRPSRTSIH